MITAQLPIAQWHDMIGEPTIADAILDRIIHNAHRIALEGDSMRRKKAARHLTNIENSETNTN
jgi:DNA replication protein DnaC